MIRIRKWSHDRGKIQNVFDGYYILKMDKITILDVLNLEKTKMSGGDQVSMGDQRVWTNSTVFRHEIMQEQ